MAHGVSTTPVVSVLMVSHDAEGSVRRAVESVQNQSLRDLELIVVDAGSEDATVRQVEAMAERDLRIDLVRADRCGRQAALDVALERARGSYVLVMDADGWLAAGALAGLVDLAETRSLELVVGGIGLSLASGAGRVSETELSGDETVFLTQHDFRAAAWRLFDSGQLLPASAKLFDRERIGRLGLAFQAGSPTDHPFVLEYLADVERVGVLEGVSYRVGRRVAERPRASSVVESYRRLESERENLLALYRHWGLEGDAASMEMLQSRYMERLVACIEGVCGKGSPLPAAEQRRIVSHMIGTDHAQLAASLGHPRGPAARSMTVPIRSRNTPLVCAQARLLSLFGGRLSEAAPDAFI